MAMGGAVSRIVAALTPGAGVVTSRGHVQYVVTEYGVVDLAGQPLRRRAELLVSIAPPTSADHATAATPAPKAIELRPARREAFMRVGFPQWLMPSREPDEGRGFLRCRGPIRGSIASP